MTDYSTAAETAALIQTATPEQQWLQAQVERIDPHCLEQGHDGAYTRALEALVLEQKANTERFQSELNAYDKALRCEGWHFEARIQRAKELAEAPATITRLQGEAGVLRELMVIALSVIGTLEPEEASECVMLMELQNQITAAVTPPGQKSYGPQCTCLGSQLGPHYFEVHSA